MAYTYTLTAEQQTIMDAKAALGKETVGDLITFKMNEYIEACKRDVGLDIKSKLHKEIEEQTTAEKQALLDLLNADPNSPPPELTLGQKLMQVLKHQLG